MDGQQEDTGRVATLNHDSSDNPLGIAVFLTADELRQLGVNPGDSEQVEYRVEDSQLQLRPTE